MPRGVFQTYRTITLVYYENKNFEIRFLQTGAGEAD